MSDTMTKKSQGKRVMKRLPAWTGLNKTTPILWFDRWSDFLYKLLLELGFEHTHMSQVKKKRGKEWEQNIDYFHSVLGSYTIVLSRKRRQEGGSLTINHRGKSTIIKTVIFQTYGYGVMCRSDVGDKILEAIRDNWNNENSDQEDQGQASNA